MNCILCKEGFCIRKGVRNGIQRYYCKKCNKVFQNEYHYKACYSTTNTMITKTLKEGCGVRSISRILGISKNTVLSRMLKISNAIQKPLSDDIGKIYEIDEIWTFLKNKKNVIWITYCIERSTRKVIDFVVGSKSIANIKPIIKTVLAQSPERVYTDKLNIYPNLLPKHIHRVFQYCTNIIERKNLTLRTHIKRLTRKSICFSKEKQYLEAHLQIYFWR